MKEDYINYLNEHSDNVKKAYQLLKEFCPKIFESLSNETLLYLEQNINVHDLSKFNSDEFDSYYKYFYISKEMYKEEFDKAFQKHHETNLHHHQHWLKKEKDGQVIAIDMPIEYVIEMVCDWWSFSIKKGNLLETINWYDRNKSSIILSPKTELNVQFILNEITQAFGKPISVIQSKEY